MDNISRILEHATAVAEEMENALAALKEAIARTKNPVVDARGIPTSTCPACGSTLFNIIAEFDDNYEISSYLLDSECTFCGCLLTAPTPLDVRQG